jgi:hypothetical protein
MRIVVTLSLAVGVVVALAAAPAAAKPDHGTDDPGVAVVSIAGAGLADPILWSGDPARKLLELTTFHLVGATSANPPADLGPSVRAAYRVVDGDGSVLTLAQDLYPCAEADTVWAFTPPGQDDVRLSNGASVTAGWSSSVALFPTLREAGLPPCAALGANVAVAAGAGASAGGSNGPTGLWFGLVLVAALVAAGALGSRTGRRPSDATVPGR